MIKKIFVFLTALSLMTSIPATAVSAAGEEETPTTETTVAPTDEIIEDITGDEIVSLEEFLERNEELQTQIDEIRQLFEDNGYSIDGLNGNVENLNGEIDGLQMSLNDLYSLINALQAQQRNSTTSSVSGGSGGDSSTPQQTTPKPQPTAVTTTITMSVEPNTEPNGYLVEKVDKYPEERDFITVTTRDGHVFYIVIDYESENQNVYFLNTVDTADLKYLLEENSTVTTTFNVKSENKATETKAADTTEETKKETTEKKKNSNTVLYIIGVIVIVVFVFIAKKKVSGGKKKVDDDEGDSGDDYTEEEPEIYVNEDSQEDDYE